MVYTCPEHGLHGNLTLKDWDSQKGWLEPQHWPYAMLTPGSVPERKHASQSGRHTLHKQDHWNTLAIRTTCTWILSLAAKNNNNKNTSQKATISTWIWVLWKSYTRHINYLHLKSIYPQHHPNSVGSRNNLHLYHAPKRTNRKMWQSTRYVCT